MDEKIVGVLTSMMQKNCGDSKRIEHSLKVYGYAKYLGVSELLNDNLLMVLELTALLHDIGIQVAEKKYGYSTVHFQEVEGPKVAREILSGFGYEQNILERVCFIISKHHTFSAIDGIDFQLLVEADFLVNSTEENATDEQIIGFARNNFKSKSGFNTLKLLFPHITESLNKT